MSCFRYIFGLTGSSGLYLFAVLRALDHSDSDLIRAGRFPEEGLGHAINDRLRRASASR